ncbi:hypothetical protein JIM95_009930 [Corynebacterium sp. CCM 8835]|uniref:Histone n=1 Tax=Corynebacterium antarcticum TaxID=2800405 RepID=A0ABS1FJ17_9CORY|nr:hypothetical protein [Corynebacterium antarcticum]MCK7643390.1 hypothetical protein [Corynebacterium antarcticum]MCL0246448.1 hypothetical protein [Corynebacterium antarcticum]MCX7541236.1 hypothetical protein [Corynebacterium antarcticum]
MPPKVTDTRTTNAESLHTVEENTAKAARRIVATYSTDFFDCVTLASMLGVAPERLNYRKIAAEHAEAAEAESAKSRKKTTKKTTAKKTTAKKTTKKTAAKKTTAKKTTAKKTTKKTAAKKTTKKA